MKSAFVATLIVWVAGPAAFAAESVVRASTAGARLDSDLLKGGGTDDTQVLQSILNTAKNAGRVHLIVDGPALIGGLEVYSHTVIECTAGGGFYLKDDADRAMVRNAHRSRTEMKDGHIRIRGCFFNGNREGQRHKGGPFQSQLSAKRYNYSERREPDGTYKSGLQFFGVHHVTVEDVILWHTRSFGAWFANAKHVVLRDIVVDTRIPAFPDSMDPVESRRFLDRYRTNDDGLHFNGPMQFLTIDGLKMRTEDDGIGLNANDMGVNDITALNEMGPHVGQGPITDVLVRNVMFMDSLVGIRLLSSDQRIDRVVIESVTGTIRGRLMILSHFIDRLESKKNGDFGAIIFSNINVNPAPFAKMSQIIPEWSR